jgi:glycosyltransferase involved in cell wall biosynthesis
MKPLKIGIIGTRGIPNHYGGFEQAASFIASGLAARGHLLTVYSSHNHPYREKKWNDVEIIRCYDPESKTGTAGQFIYDLNCIRHARNRNYDVLLFMGYTSSSLWGRFYPKKTVIVSNMDGLEWKRAKYTAPVRKYLRLAEKWAMRYSHFYIADSTAIQSYLKEKYNAESCFIPYGAELVNHPSPELLSRFDVQPGKYFLLIARMEPENNIEMILDGYIQSGSQLPFIITGNTHNNLGRKLQNKYRENGSVIFTSSIFDTKILQALRACCRMYFHGHSVGGTNPSLLEAMAAGALIASHNNPFNKAVVGTDGFYFSNPQDVRSCILEAVTTTNRDVFKQNNIDKIKSVYNWDIITDQYEQFLSSCYQKHT